MLENFRKYLNESKFPNKAKDYIIFYFQDGSELELQKKGNQWVERDFQPGSEMKKPPYGWGDATYEGYLKPEDIYKWLSQDYDLPRLYSVEAK
jgi:hypothetical protein